MTGGLFMYLTNHLSSAGPSHIYTQACLSDHIVHILVAETLFLSRSLPTEPRRVLSLQYVFPYTFNEVYKCTVGRFRVLWFADLPWTCSSQEHRHRIWNFLVVDTTSSLSRLRVLLSETDKTINPQCGSTAEKLGDSLWASNLSCQMGTTAIHTCS